MQTLLTIDDLVQKWRIPKRSLYVFAQKGKIPGALKIGKHWRFREDMIEKWILEQTEPVSPQKEAVVSAIASQNVSDQGAASGS